MRRLVVLAVVLVSLAAASAAVASAAVPFDMKHFVAAIRSASVPTPADVDTQLFELSDANRQLVWRPGSARDELLVAAVMTPETYAKYYASGSGSTPASRPVLWVTLAPQLKSWCHRLARSLRRAGLGRASRTSAAERVRRRVVQWLGLSPMIDYSRVVNLWVDRTRLFRPCPDPGVTDRRCQLKMDGTPHVIGISDYPSFFASLYVSSYSLDGAPWTRLGYTYDWGGQTRFGASEYMVTTSTRYVVGSAATVADYCR